MIQILAILSASASGGIRLGLPLLIIGLANLEKLWTDLPLLDKIRPEIILAILVSWTFFEFFGTKKLVGLRVIQLVQLILSPLVGGILAVGTAKWVEFTDISLWIIGITGGLVALVLRLVLVGWFFRWGKMPIIFIFVEDFLSGILAIFALKAPENGGLIAMILLWLALRSSSEWRSWYLQHQKQSHNKFITNPDNE